MCAMIGRKLFRSGAIDDELARFAWEFESVRFRWTAGDQITEQAHRKSRYRAATWARQIALVLKTFYALSERITHLLPEPPIPDHLLVKSSHTIFLSPAQRSQLRNEVINPDIDRRQHNNWGVGTDSQSSEKYLSCPKASHKLLWTQKAISWNAKAQTQKKLSSHRTSYTWSFLRVSYSRNSTIGDRQTFFNIWRSWKVLQTERRGFLLACRRTCTKEYELRTNFKVALYVPCFLLHIRAGSNRPYSQIPVTTSLYYLNLTHQKCRGLEGYSVRLRVNTVNSRRTNASV